MCVCGGRASRWKITAGLSNIHKTKHHSQQLYQVGISWRTIPSNNECAPVLVLVSGKVFVWQGVWWVFVFERVEVQPARRFVRREPAGWGALLQQKSGQPWPEVSRSRRISRRMGFRQPRTSSCSCWVSRAGVRYFDKVVWVRTLGSCAGTDVLATLFAIKTTPRWKIRYFLLYLVSNMKFISLFIHNIHRYNNIPNFLSANQSY